MISRYQRQVVLPEVGQAGQDKIARARVLCVGAGGLGSPALLYLAAAGIGHIGIADHDRVEETNLQRQILFTEADIGRPKALAARERLLALNSRIDVTAYEEGLHVGNAEALFSAYDIIIDATDNFPAKYLINDAALKCHKPWIYGAIQGFEGQVSVFDASQGPCYRCLYPEAPRAPVLNCAESGVMGAVAGVVGTMQAMQVIQLVLGEEGFEPLQGKLRVVDLHTITTHTFKLEKNKSCPLCTTPAAEIRLSYAPLVCVAEVSPAQLAYNAAILLVDVREAAERTLGHIDGDIHFPLSRLEAGQPFTASKTAEIVVYCQQGIRSRKVAALLRQQGYTKVSSLAGGYGSYS